MAKEILVIFQLNFYMLRTSVMFYPKNIHPQSNPAIETVTQVKFD